MVCIEVDCGSPWRIPGAQHNNATGTTYGSTFEFGCDSSRGFQVKGTSALLNNTVICQSSGRWGYGNLTCEGMTTENILFFFLCMRMKRLKGWY